MSEERKLESKLAWLPGTLAVETGRSDVTEGRNEVVRESDFFGNKVGFDHVRIELVRFTSSPTSKSNLVFDIKHREMVQLCFCKVNFLDSHRPTP